MIAADQQFSVPVKTWLQPDVYRTLERLATQRQTTVAVLVAVAAQHSVTPRKELAKRRPMPRKGKFSDPVIFEQFTRMVAANIPVAVMAEAFDVTPATIYNHLHRARSHQ